MCQLRCQALCRLELIHPHNNQRVWYPYLAPGWGRRNYTPRLQKKAELGSETELSTPLLCDLGQVAAAVWTCFHLHKEKIREPLALWALVRIKVDNGCKYHRVPGSQPSEVRSGPALSSLSHQLPCQGLQAGTDLFHSSRHRAGRCLHTHSHTQSIADQQFFSPGASGARNCPGSTRGGHSGARPLLPLSFWVAWKSLCDPLPLTCCGLPWDSRLSLTSLGLNSFDSQPFTMTSICPPHSST